MKRVDRCIVLLVLSGVLALAAGASPAVASQDFVFQKAMLKGEPAPGTEPGTVFGPVSDAYLTNLPSLDESGKIFFVATLEGPEVTASNRTGIWFWNQGAVSLVARAGDSAPDIPGGYFASFPLDFVLVPPTAGGGRLGFSATVSGPGIDYTNDEGFWALTAGELHLLAREGSPAPGLPAGIDLRTPFGLEINRAGHAFTGGLVAGPGINSENDQAFWSDRDGTLVPLLREGDPAPDVGPGVTFGGAGEFVGTGYTFESVSWNHASGLALQGNLTGSGVTAFNNEAMFAERAGALTLLAREGSPAPGLQPGEGFGANSVTADFGAIMYNSLEQAAFTARVGGNSSTYYVLFSNHTGSLWPVARPGDPAPGTDQHFGILTSEFLSDGGRIAFCATFYEGGTYPPLGLWWDQPGQAGELFPVAIPGDPAPGRPGVSIRSVNSIASFNGAGQLVFGAMLDDPAYGSRTALLLAEPAGQLREVVATRDLFDVQGSAGPGLDLREISSIKFGGMNPSGQVATRLDFTDGSFGVYGVSTPATSAVDTPPVRGIQLAQNVPNPFYVSTRFEFALAEPGRVGLNLYDASGRLVRRLLDEPRAAGPHTIMWDGRNHEGAPLTSGIYWARLEAGASSRSIRVVLLRH